MTSSIDRAICYTYLHHNFNSADRTNCDDDDERQSVDHTKEVSPQVYVGRCHDVMRLKNTKMKHVNNDVTKPLQPPIANHLFQRRQWDDIILCVTRTLVKFQRERDPTRPRFQ